MNQGKVQERSDVCTHRLIISNCRAGQRIIKYTYFKGGRERRKEGAKIKAFFRPLKVSSLN